MITFWIFAIAMVIVALIFLLRPLLLELTKSDIDRAAQNVAITKERLNELKIEFEQGTITKEEYEQTKEELEQALLNDVEESAVKSKSSSNESFTRLTRYFLIFSVPVLAISFYVYLGQPDLIEGAKKQAAAPAGHDTTANGKRASVEEMVEKLAARMKEQPDNAEGWYMLGRSYMSMGRYQEAVAALEKTNKLVPDNYAVMLRYADALTMLRGGRISGKPFELIKKAVEIKPDDTTGLWLLGMGYEEKGEYKKAISYWQQLIPLLKDNKSTDEVNKLIRAAKKKSGINLTDSSSVTASSVNKLSDSKSNASLKISVSINKSRLKNVSMEDIVFVFAKAVNGPPMPLAVARKKVKDLPLVVTLDDTMAMIPSMKMSNFTNVQISARVSKSGQPRAQSGDVQSEILIVKSSQKETIKLMINKILP